jgi:hypothetical protein
MTRAITSVGWMLRPLVVYIVASSGGRRLLLTPASTVAPSPVRELGPPQWAELPADLIAFFAVLRRDVASLLHHGHD